MLIVIVNIKTMLIVIVITKSVLFQVWNKVLLFATYKLFGEGYLLLSTPWVFVTTLHRVSKIKKVCKSEIRILASYNSEIKQVQAIVERPKLVHKIGQVKVTHLFLWMVSSPLGSAERSTEMKFIHQPWTKFIICRKFNLAICLIIL